MTIRILIIAFLTALLGSVAHAQFEFDCKPNLDAEACDEARLDAWDDLYGDLRTHWYDQLLFNRNIYFQDYDGTPIDPKMAGTPNMVDVYYDIAIFTNLASWAFAIDLVGEAPADQRPVIRVVSIKQGDEWGDDETAAWDDLPTSIEDAAKQLHILGKWQEADLRSCPWAMEHLALFPGQNIVPLWAEDFMDQLQRGPQPEPELDEDERVLPKIYVDGDGVHIRAQARTHPVTGSPYRQGYLSYSESNDGAAYDWALDMLDIVQPCLVPSQADAPWEKIVAYRAERVLEE